MSNLPDGWNGSEGVSCAGWDIWIGYRKTMPKYTWATWWRRLDDGFDNSPYKMGKLHRNHDEALAAIREIRKAFHAADYGAIEEMVSVEMLPEYGAF